MVKIKARYFNGKKAFSKVDIENIVITNEKISTIIDRVNERLAIEDNID